jgi:hypothetical protein
MENPYVAMSGRRLTSCPVRRWSTINQGGKQRETVASEVCIEDRLTNVEEKRSE